GRREPDASPHAWTLPVAPGVRRSPPMTDLGGAHVVITGGSSGIGLATAQEAVARGARVSLLARDATRLADAAASVAAVATASVDVAQADALRGALDDVVAEGGPCDVLITAAGSSHPGYFEPL